jgi:hypothetical protein
MPRRHNQLKQRATYSPHVVADMAKAYGFMHATPRCEFVQFPVVGVSLEGWPRELLKQCQGVRVYRKGVIVLVLQDGKELALYGPENWEQLKERMR